MIPIRFNTPALGPEHWEKIRQITANTIGNSMSKQMRIRFKTLVEDLEPENSFGMIEAFVGEENHAIFIPYLFPSEKLTEDIRDFLWICYMGSHEYYCKENELLNK